MIQSTGTPNTRPNTSRAFDYDGAGNLVFTFGSHEGDRVDLEIDYLKWMMAMDFNEDTLEVCQDIIDQYGG